MPAFPRDIAVIALGYVLAAGCEDLSEFRTDQDHVFRGEVIGSDPAVGDAGEALDAGVDPGGSFIRKGFPSFTEMELSFDPEIAARFPPDEPPGRIDTAYPCSEEVGGCEPGDRVAGPFVDAPLEPIESLTHDALSQYDFPGGGRIRNYIFGSRFETGAEDTRVARHAMVFVSLMDTGNIEVRVIAPSVRAPGSERDLHPPLFGVFVLKRQAR